MDTVERWIVASPDCGRDKNGTYRCVCGRCRRLPPNESQDGRNGSDNSGQRGNNANHCIDNKPAAFRPLL